METYNDGYENGDPQFEMYLQSSEWTIKQTQNLLEQYKKCRTEHARNRTLKKLTSAWQKLNYEGRKLESLIKKIKEDEGLI